MDVKMLAFQLLVVIHKFVALVVSKGASQLLLCYYIQHNFISAYLLLDHFSGRKSFISSRNQCTYCSQTFTSRIARNRHEIFVCSQNPDVVKPHTCKLCRRSFLTNVKLIEHMSEKHENKEVVMQEKKCEQCGMTFKRANSLYVHRRTAHKIKEPKYHCTHCGKAFHFKDPYNMHVATHSGEWCVYVGGGRSERKGG